MTGLRYFVLWMLTPKTDMVTWPYIFNLTRRESHTGIMDYDQACKMHLTPGVVHNFPKAVGV